MLRQAKLIWRLFLRRELILGIHSPTRLAVDRGW